MRGLSGLKVLVSTSAFGAAIKLLKKEGLKLALNPYRRKLTKGELVKLVGKDTVGLIAGLETLDREVMLKSGLRVISRCGSGLDNVDLKAAGDLGIKVYSTPDAPVTSVAELTVAAMLSLLRGIPQMDRDMHNGSWVKITGSQLKDKTVAIIGFGRIGQYLVKLLLPFGVKILAVDPKQAKASGVKFTTLKKALCSADIITLHAEANREILGVQEFRLIKEGAYLLNCSRGKLVNERALIKAIKAGALRGAWIDVYNQEPYSGPLKNFQQVILTPHVGSYSRECRLRMETEAAENLIAGLREVNIRRR